MTTTCKALVDDFGRVIGACEVSRRNTGRTEYGGRRDGMLDVHGIASVRPISSTGYKFAGVGTEADGHRYAIVVNKRTGMSDAWRVYETA